MAALALAGLATGLCTMAQMVRETVPVMARAAADDSWDLPLTAAEQQAMEWVRQNDARSGAAGHQPYARARRWKGFQMYSGLSGRRFYMEASSMPGRTWACLRRSCPAGGRDEGTVRPWY